jgi:hypothetical protein
MGIEPSLPSTYIQQFSWSGDLNSWFLSMTNPGLKSLISPWILLGSSPRGNTVFVSSNRFNGLSLPLWKTQVTDLGTPNTELVTIPSERSMCSESSGSKPQPWTLDLLWGSLCLFHMVCPSGYCFALTFQHVLFSFPPFLPLSFFPCIQSLSNTFPHTPLPLSPHCSLLH